MNFSHLLSGLLYYSFKFRFDNVYLRLPNYIFRLSGIEVSILPFYIVYTLRIEFATSLYSSTVL